MQTRIRTLAGAGLAMLILHSGCSSTANMPDDATREINAILDQVSSTFAEEGARRCLPTSSYRHVRIVDDRRLIFRGNGDRAWLNDLRRQCHGLKRRDRLAFELRDNRVCEMDFVRAVEPGLPLGGTGATCLLGNFKPIPPSHAEYIDQLLRDR